MESTGSFCCLHLLFKRSSSVMKLQTIKETNCKICCVD